MTVNIGWPEAIILVFLLIGLGLRVQARPDWVVVVGGAIGIILELGLLYWGGFFS